VLSLEGAQKLSSEKTRINHDADENTVTFGFMGPSERVKNKPQTAPKRQAGATSTIFTFCDSCRQLWMRISCQKI
jgi:hypothetical protein